MPSSYSDIKRYNFETEFIIEMMKTVLIKMDFSLTNESPDMIEAETVIDKSGHREIIKIVMHFGCLFIQCTSNSEQFFISSCKNHVEHFLNQMDSLINSLPREEILKFKTSRRVHR